ncbi:MAG: glycogen debranching protein GlgX [Azoarcus sp.]|nr:glycogen debranching protein GlgX [Azoarcus sp.]
MNTPADSEPPLLPGRPWPLGACCVSPGSPPANDTGIAAKSAAKARISGPVRAASGVNFAVWAPDADRMELCLFDDLGETEVRRLDLPCCTDGVWHGFLPGARPGLVYGLRAHGPWAPHRGQRFNPAKVLLDPWAFEVVGQYHGYLDAWCGQTADDPPQPDGYDNAAVALKARVVTLPPAVRVSRPLIPAGQTVLYEAHVRSLTMRHPAIPEALRGSYAGVAHPVMLAHYKALGITTLNLLPVQFRADEAALQRRGLSNHWGYSSIAWLAPEPRYWSGRPGTTAASELREMVSTLHGAGLEVVLDIVFNHTAETDEFGPTLSLRGLANARYYHLDPQDPARYRNWTGCGNSVDLSEPRVVELVTGALRHWVESYGVDGFRLDLASTLARGRDGHFSTRAGFFAAVQSDPVLAQVKWIAEPWDLGPDGYQLGAFPPGWGEWNDQYRDAMRAWWLRGGGDRGSFAHRFAASGTQFHHSAKAPTASINFLTAHDGFTLRDLVSYDQKHNEANGELNRDGHHHNNSWNCGIEGPTESAEVETLRTRLQTALLATLLSAQGTPMLLAGDEIGHTQAGNNNAYCQDNEISWLDWEHADRELVDCVSRLLSLRHKHAALRQSAWLSDGRHDGAGRTVLWLHPEGRRLTGVDWHAPGDRALAIWLHPGAPDAEHANAVLLLVNPDDRVRSFVLPAGHWRTEFDSGASTATPRAQSTDGGIAPVVPDETLDVAARSFLILVDPRDPTDLRAAVALTVASST